MKVIYFCMVETKKIHSSIKLTPSDHAFLVARGGLTKQISSYILWLKAMALTGTPPPCIYVHSIRVGSSRSAGSRCPLMQQERTQSEPEEMWNRDPAALQLGQKELNI